MYIGYGFLVILNELKSEFARMFQEHWLLIVPWLFETLALLITTKAQLFPFCFVDGGGGSVVIFLC